MMSLQPLTAVNCAGLLQPGCSLLQLDGDTLLFGQKGWPKRSCPTGVFGVRIKETEFKLRPISFSNNSCYLPPLRCPAIARLEPRNGSPESYVIHGGRTPNNDLSSALYVLGMESRGCNRKLTLSCQEKELAGEPPSARYGHTASVVHSRGKRACVLFGGRSYQPPGQRTTETWNSMVDCPPQVFVVDLDYGCCSAHYLPELTDGQSFHLALSRGDCVYLLGGHTLASDSRPSRLLRLRVELLLGSPKLSCEVLDNGLSITSPIATRLSPARHEYVVLGGYQADQQKQLQCHLVALDENGIRIEPQAAPPWNGEISSSRLWFGGSLGKGNALLAVPAEGNPAPADAFYLYQVSFEQEGADEESGNQGYSQESTDLEDSTPLEDSEELYFGRDPHEMLEMLDSDGEGGVYNEDDEEDETQTGYWIRCCAGCQVDPNTWEPFYSTELTRPAMIFCSRGEGGHWVHAQCMELPEVLLLRLSENNCKYFCLDHAGQDPGGPGRQERTPPRQELPVKRTPMKPLHKKTPVKLNMTPAKKTFLRRLFE